MHDSVQYKHDKWAFRVYHCDSAGIGGDLEMQRVSDGLAVPKLMLEHFTGKTTDASGYITCELKYTPTSKEDVIVESIRDAPIGDMHFAKATGLTGKTLTVYVLAAEYNRADTIGNANSGGAGADPHTHALNSSTQAVMYNAYVSSGLGPVTISYKVA